MEQLIEIGILQQSDEQDNLYEKILARIAKSDVSSAVLSVKVVHALSNLVFVVKNRWKDKVPTSKLTKKQFVHILAYICDRNSTFELERPLLRYQLKTVFGDQLNGLGTS